MTEPGQTKRKLLEDALASYKDEYKELADTWKQVEGKAQGVVTICGVFLAGVFAFAREVATGKGRLELVLLASATVLLIVSVVLALFAVRVRRVLSPPSGATHGRIVGDLLAADEADWEWDNYLHDQIRLWESANKSIADANSQKAQLVQLAQWVLFAAIVCAEFVTAITIWE